MELYSGDRVDTDQSELEWRHKDKMGDSQDGDAPAVKQASDADPEVVLSRTRPLGTSRRHTFYEAPEFVKRLNAFEEAECGSSVIFECQWRGLPKPAIKWYKDDEEITENDHYQVHEAEGGLLTLVIEDAHKDDEGAYKCKAENKEGVASTTGYLSITGDERERPLSSQPRKNPDHSVSSAPPLRTIVEQRTLEAEEEEELEHLPPSPLQEFIDSLPLNRRSGFIFPSQDQVTVDKDAESSGSDTSVDSQDFARVADIDPTEMENMVETPDEQPGIASDNARTEQIHNLVELNNKEKEAFAEVNERERARKSEIIAAIVEREQEEVKLTSIEGEATLERVPTAEAMSMFTQSITDEETENLPRESSPEAPGIEFSAPRPIKESVSNIIHLVKQKSREVEEQLRIPWLYYFAFISIATFFASATEFSPSLYIIILAILSLISFRILVQTTCT